MVTTGAFAGKTFPRLLLLFEEIDWFTYFVLGTDIRLVTTVEFY
jgi:hypothetical protein